MAEVDLLFGNPFLAAMRNYISDPIHSTLVARRVDAIQEVVQQLMEEGAAEYASTFLKILSDRVVKFFPEKLAKTTPWGGGSNRLEEYSYIYRFASDREIPEADYILVLERAALLWEEVDGDTDKIFPKAAPNPQSLNTNIQDKDKCEDAIILISEILDVLQNPQVQMIQSRNGLQILIPSELQYALFGSKGKLYFSIMDFLREFPNQNNDAWFEMFMNLSAVVSHLQLRPILVYDAPVADLNVREEIDGDLFIMILEETIKNIDAKIKPFALSAVPTNSGNQMSEIFQMEYSDGYEW